MTIAAGDKTAIEWCEQDVPKVVVTGMNRQGEDMAGLHLVRAMRRRWPRLGAVYMAAGQLGCVAVRSHDASVSTKADSG